jgi:hypothetical protein
MLCFSWLGCATVSVKTYKTIILQGVLYRCEFWSLGPRRDEVTGEWRKLHNEELRNMFSSPNIIRQIKSRRMRCAGHAARMGEERKVYKVLVGKPEGKSPLGRTRRRWEGGMRIYLGEVGWEGGVDSLGSGYGPVAGCCECSDEPSGSGTTELRGTTSYHIRDFSWICLKRNPFGLYVQDVYCAALHGLGSPVLTKFPKVFVTLSSFRKVSPIGALPPHVGYTARTPTDQYGS